MTASGVLAVRLIPRLRPLPRGREKTIEEVFRDKASGEDFIS